MDQVFQQGDRKQAMHFRGMKKLPRECVTKGPVPLVGYKNQSRVLCGLDEQLVLLDGGASCGTIPEWRFGEIYEQVSSRIVPEFKREDPINPIARICDFPEEAQGMTTFKADLEILTNFYIHLPLQFVGIGKTSGPLQARRMVFLELSLQLLNWGRKP